MAKHHRWLEATVPLLAGWLMVNGGAGSATGAPGYLPVVGPVQVRFQAPSPIVPPVLWPPLIKPEKQAMPAETQLTNAPVADSPPIEPPAIAITSSMTDLGPLTSPAPAQPALAIPFAIPAPSQPDQVTDALVDLQAKLNYLLSVSTNEPGAKVTMPGFVPAVPPPSYPSSHATYESQ